MKYPQTLAREFCSVISPARLETIGKYGCCAFVLLWCLGIEPDNMEAIELVNDMINAGVIEKDCTVHWVEAVKFLTGRDITVEFKNIKDILSIKDRTPVRYDYKGQGHWVGVERGMIAFNPLKQSNCVDKGVPVTARIIKLK
jgi:hypothetical protein